MKYEIYIDESGTINQYKKGVFEVAFLIINKENAKKTKKFYAKKMANFRKENGILKNTELKAHFLKENNFLDFIDNIFHGFTNKNKIVSAYVDNRDIKSKSNYSDERFFHIIELIIGRCIERKYLTENDEIEIFADQRNNLSGEMHKLKSKCKVIHKIFIKNFEFLDSSKNTLIQVADIISFKCNRIIIKSLKNKTKTPTIPNVSFRRIYY